jgi:hypothetical protein
MIVSLRNRLKEKGLCISITISKIAHCVSIGNPEISKSLMSDGLALGGILTNDQFSSKQIDIVEKHLSRIEDSVAKLNTEQDLCKVLFKEIRVIKRVINLYKHSINQ